LIKSMTGYGFCEGISSGKHITVEIRSVNHRYSDLNIKTPRGYGYLEEPVRKCAAKFISRGKADIYVNLEGIEGEDGEVILNSALAEGYYNAMNTLLEKYNIDDSVRLEHLIRFSDVFSVRKTDENTDEIENAVCGVTLLAGEAFTAMRVKEGEKLYADLSAGLETIGRSVMQIEERAPQIVQDYSNRIRERMTEILEGHDIDENRLLNEVAVFSDRVNVNEEIVRLKSHLNQMGELFEADEPVGRKLDFLIQETNREVNTIGSKSNDIDVARIVIDIKSGIEKLREQVQNIE